MKSAFEAGRLAALQWALSKAECLSSCSNKKKWIPAYKIKAEIKNLKNGLINNGMSTEYHLISKLINNAHSQFKGE